MRAIMAWGWNVSYPPGAIPVVKNVGMWLEFGREVALLADTPNCCYTNCDDGSIP
uniref:Uncharacterized protein n=1 Tax=Picea glauca TaxID=3330 RepID=A0A101M4Y3_PICGL|nr:hypothetical protein ABT39_MTgene904 [Picea glauca]